MCVQDDDPQQRARVGADMGNALGMWIRHVLSAPATSGGAGLQQNKMTAGEDPATSGGAGLQQDMDSTARFRAALAGWRAKETEEQSALKAAARSRRKRMQAMNADEKAQELRRRLQQIWNDEETDDENDETSNEKNGERGNGPPATIFPLGRGMGLSEHENKMTYRASPQPSGSVLSIRLYMCDTWSTARGTLLSSLSLPLCPPPSLGSVHKVQLAALVATLVAERHAVARTELAVVAVAQVAAAVVVRRWERCVLEVLLLLLLLLLHVHLLPAVLLHQNISQPEHLRELDVAGRRGLANVRDGRCSASTSH
jgi:hypothetical protein